MSNWDNWFEEEAKKNSQYNPNKEKIEAEKQREIRQGLRDKEGNWIEKEETEETEEDDETEE